MLIVRLFVAVALERLGYELAELLAATEKEHRGKVETV
jgi:hypothetical protein